MRKIYAFLLAVLVSGSVFAQRAELKSLKGEPTRNQWIGNNDWTIDGKNYHIFEWNAGEEIAFSPLYYAGMFYNLGVAPDVQVTKVRFAFAPDEARPNKNFTIKIYNNIDASGLQAYDAYGVYCTLPADACGTPVYTQNVTCSDEMGWQTFDLTTPFTVTQNPNAEQGVPAEFWISITPAADSYIVTGDWEGYNYETMGTPLGIFYTFNEGTEEGDEDLWIEFVGCTTTCGNDDSDWQIQPLAIGCYFDDGGPLNLECTPMAIWTNSVLEPIHETNLPIGQTLYGAYLSLVNFGPDVIPAGETIKVDAYIGNHKLGTVGTYNLTSALDLGNQFFSGDEIQLEPSDFNNTPGIYEVVLKSIYMGQTYTDELLSSFFVYYGIDGVISNISDKVSVYPNPVATNLTISNAKDAKLTIMNNLGQTMATIENAENEQTFDVSNLSNGVYFVKIEKDADFSVVKFTVNK